MATKTPNQQEPFVGDDVEDEVVDLDLKAEDARLREAIGKPSTVRINDKVIHILHVADWSSTAMKAAVSGDWDTWASEVIPDEGEAGHFVDADLANYQLEAVFELCTKSAGVSRGKSKRSRR
jgi:hypothetical protein